MFIRYCTDMKILQFNIADAIGVYFASGFLNFGVLRGWDGRRYDTRVDIKKKSNKKVGEMLMRIEIIEIENPFHIDNEKKRIKNTDIENNDMKRKKEMNETNGDYLQEKKTLPSHIQIRNSESEYNNE